jgi:hypothetical protein
LCRKVGAPADMEPRLYAILEGLHRTTEGTTRSSPSSTSLTTWTNTVFRPWSLESARRPRLRPPRRGRQPRRETAGRSEGRRRFASI